MKPRLPLSEFNGATRLVIAVMALAFTIPSIAQKSTPPAGPQIVSVQGYPELRLDGHPFFVHAAEFSYYRVPKDLWSHSLDRFRELGINTIDLHIPWNWHEVREGEFDFDGHTNPRRDLRGLLQMIAEKDFYLIARPGPAIADDWKNNGYPEWQLKNGRGQESRWLAAIARELAPYNFAKKAATSSANGRLLFVFLNGVSPVGAVDLLDPRSSASPAELRDLLIKDGIDAHFAATDSQLENGLNRGNTNSGIATAGEWYMNQAGHKSISDPKAGGARVTDEDAQTLAFLAQNLRKQTDFPALLSGFQAGWPTPSDDAGPPRSSPSNTLLATRWLIAQGLAGIEYSPLQDSLTPPGFQNASVNRDFRWNAALDLSGEKQERAQAVTRNGKFLEMWGEFLASSHPRAGIGLVDWSSAWQSDGFTPAVAAEVDHKSRATNRRIERIALFAGLPIELVSPGKQSNELLLHNSLLLLAIPDSLRGKTFLPASTQSALIEYVLSGGVLICNPERPAGAAFDDALREAAAKPAGDGFRVTPLGRGRIIEWSKDFYSWLDPNESFADSFARQESHFAIAALKAAAQLGNLQAPVVQSTENQATLLVNELVPNEAAAMLAGQKSDCASHPRCTKGLLSVTNWSAGASVQETLKVLPPDIDPRAAIDSQYIELPVEVPARESLMLPLNFPLCSHEASAQNCPDRIVAAGAEMLGAVRDGRALELSLYAPTAATVIFHLRGAPVSADLPNMLPPGPRNQPLRASSRPRLGLDGSEIIPLGPGGDPIAVIGDPSFPERMLHGIFNQSTGTFRVVVPRGAAPNFRRILRLHLNYDPDVPEKKKPAKQHGNGYRYNVADAVRLPLNGGKSLLSNPPIVLLDKDRNGQFLIEAQNLDDSSLSLQSTVSGPEQGSASLRMLDQEGDVQTVKVHANGGAESDHEGLLRGTLSLSGGHIPDRSSPINFLAADSGAPIHYEYDFERSGSKNWVLENKHLRLILLPAAGGQISALVDKSTGTNFTTTVGGLRDLVRVPNGTGTARGNHLIDPMLNVTYDAEWLLDKNDAALRMKAQWPDGAPIAGDISKTVRMNEADGADVVEAEYRIHSRMRGDQSNSAAQSRNENVAIVSAFSVPAVAEKPDGTQICWKPRALQTAADASANAGAAAQQCVPFIAGGNSIEIPPDAGRVEIQTPGRPTLAMEWIVGRVTIEQKVYSARILLEFPAGIAASDTEEVRFVVRYILVRAQ